MLNESERYRDSAYNNNGSVDYRATSIRCNTIYPNTECKPQCKTHLESDFQIGIHLSVLENIKNKMLENIRTQEQALTERSPIQEGEELLETKRKLPL